MKKATRPAAKPSAPRPSPAPAKRTPPPAKPSAKPAPAKPSAKPAQAKPAAKPAPAKRTPPPPRKPAPSRKANPAPVSNKPAAFPSALVCLPCLPRDTVGKIGLAVFRFLATLAPWRLLSPLAAEKAAQAAADRLRQPRTPRAPFPFLEILAILPRPVPERWVCEKPRTCSSS